MSTPKVESASPVSSTITVQSNAGQVASYGGHLGNLQSTIPLGSYQNSNKFEKQKINLSFCPKCKMLLRVANRNHSSLRCKKCGYQLKVDDRSVYGGKSYSTNNASDKIAVIDKEKSSLHTYPIVQAICERCGKNESETWAISVGSEGTTSALVFLRCTGCGYTRREVG